MLRFSLVRYDSLQNVGAGVGALDGSELREGEPLGAKVGDKVGRTGALVGVGVGANVGRLVGSGTGCWVGGFVHAVSSSRRTSSAVSFALTEMDEINKRPNKSRTIEVVIFVNEIVSEW